MSSLQLSALKSAEAFIQSEVTIRNLLYRATKHESERVDLCKAKTVLRAVRAAIKQIEGRI